MGLLLALLASFVLSTAHSLPEYCGKTPGKYVPLSRGPNGEEYTLKQVHVVIRFVGNFIDLPPFCHMCIVLLLLAVG